MKKGSVILFNFIESNYPMKERDLSNLSGLKIFLLPCDGKENLMVKLCNGFCRFVMAFVVFSVSNLMLTLSAALITVFVSPAAAGSGIPEVKAYLNGVDAPGIFSLNTLFVKVIQWYLVMCL